MALDTKNFKVSELLCKCCGQGVDVIQQPLLDVLQRIRDDYGWPMVVNCGYRCPKHNKEVNGAPNSAHLYGMAADISDVDGKIKSFMTLENAEKYNVWCEQYHWTSSWIHVSTRPAASRFFKP